MGSGPSGHARAASGVDQHISPGVVPVLPLAFIGTYPPRRCGIATFTRDLSQAVGQRARPMVIAVTDAGGQYEYPAEVKYEVRQALRADYVRAAELINYSDVQLVSVQHEYGIFGGDDGDRKSVV